MKEALFRASPEEEGAERKAWGAGTRRERGSYRCNSTKLQPSSGDCGQRKPLWGWRCTTIALPQSQPQAAATSLSHLPLALYSMFMSVCSLSEPWQTLSSPAPHFYYFPPMLLALKTSSLKQGHAVILKLLNYHTLCHCMISLFFFS